MPIVTRAESSSAKPHPVRLRPLLRGELLPISVLVVSSIIAGLSEAGILATTAQVAAALVDGTRTIHADLGPLHVTETIAGLLVVALVLAATRLVLQVPLAIVPARLSADVQARMQRQLFNAFTRASWTEQADDREGHLQELVMNQTLQATLSAMAATTLVTSALTFLY